MTSLLFGAISLAWLVVGLVLLTVPSRFHQWLHRGATEPLPRFFLTQGLLFVGLLLLVTSLTEQPSWAWVGVGWLCVLYALLLLGLPARVRVRLVQWCGPGQSWLARVGGVGLVVLATLLGLNVIRGGF